MRGSVRMEKFSEHLRKLMTQRGLSAAELARKTGLSEAAISGYLHGKKEPRGVQSISIARALGVTLDTLWQTDFASDTLSTEESVFVEMFRLLNREGRLKLKTYMEDLIKSGHDVPDDAPPLKIAARSGGVKNLNPRQKRDRDKIVKAENKF